MGLAWGWCGFLEAEGGGTFISFGTQGPASFPRGSQETQESCCRAGWLALHTLGVLAEPLLEGCSWLPGVRMKETLPTPQGEGFSGSVFTLQALPSLIFWQNHS